MIQKPGFALRLSPKGFSEKPGFFYGERRL